MTKVISESLVAGRTNFTPSRVVKKPGLGLQLNFYFCHKISGRTYFLFCLSPAKHDYEGVQPVSCAIRVPPRRVCTITQRWVV